MNRPPLRKMKPHIGFYQEIHGLQSLRQSSKKNHKHLFQLKITKHEDQETHKLKFYKLSRILSSSKILKVLNLSDFMMRNLNFPQLKIVVQKLHYIEKFSGPWDGKAAKSLLPAFLFLKNVKYLRDLFLRVSFNEIPRRFLQILRLCKIRTLHLTGMDTSEGVLRIHLSKYLPSNVENLSLFWRVTCPIAKFQHPFMIKRLENLKKLELGMPLGDDILNDIFKGIQNPLKLKCLRFSAVKISDLGSKIGGFLKKCLNLEELNVKTQESPMISFYKKIKNLSLKKLVIEQLLEKDKDISRLGDLIWQQRNTLESLSLNLCISSSSASWDFEPWFDKLFENIKALKRLKRIELIFVHDVLSSYFLISGLLTELLEELDGLEEINFKGVRTGDFRDDKKSFGRFCKALQKHDKSLRSLKLFINPYFHLQNTSSILINTLKMLSKLEHLTLGSFHILDLDFYEGLGEIVCGKRSRLNSLVLADVKRHAQEREREKLIKMLKDIICKPTMRILDFRADKELVGEVNWLKKSEVLDLSDVSREVHHFDYLQLPEGVCTLSFGIMQFYTRKWFY